jgi:hypothetical protein
MRGPFSKNFDPAQDLPDLKGKIIILTGGKWASRSSRRLETFPNVLLSSASQRGGVGSGKWRGRLKLDLSDPREAKKSAEHFLRHELIKAAGRWSSDAFERYIRKNPFALLVGTAFDATRNDSDRRGVGAVLARC